LWHKGTDNYRTILDINFIKVLLFLPCRNQIESRIVQSNEY
jgi:hypothetical protein